MPRFKLTIEYDGTPFVGWQRQQNGNSVQQTLEEAAERFCGAPTRVSGAGRTDAGVHATGQVAHLDFVRDWPADTVRDAINAHMRAPTFKAPVSVLAAERVSDDFDARFSATRRHYLYRIVNRRPPLALERNAWHVAARLDEGVMHEGAQQLLGRHDFTTFRAAQCQAQSPIRTLDQLDVLREGDVISVIASARSFLHNQVRSMVGSLVEVGLGRWQPAGMGDALAAADRRRCGAVAPATGLFLTGVDYADADEGDA